MKSKKVVIGQVVIAIQIVTGIPYSLLIIAAENYNVGFQFLLWTLVYIPLLLWSRKNYKKAFITTLFYYVITVSLKLVFTNSEFIRTYFAHMIYFVSCMLIGISAKRKPPLDSIETSRKF